MNTENIVVSGNVEDNNDTVNNKPVKKVRKPRTKKNDTNDNIVTPEVIVETMIKKLTEYNNIQFDGIKDGLSCDLNKMTIPLLKMVCKHFKIKLMSKRKKADLIIYILENYERSISLINIQFIMKRALAMKWLSLHGPGLMNKVNCVNDMDLMGEDIIDLPLDQFFSFADNGFTYAFNMATFSSLIYQNNMSYRGRRLGLLNPYTRDKVSNSVLKDFKRLVSLSVLFNRNFYLVHNDDKMDRETSINDTPVSANTPPNPTNMRVTNNPVSITRTLINGDVELDFTPEEVDYDIRSIFYVIDTYGYYTNPEWVLNMSINNLKGFIQNMVEIFNYRANLSSRVKQMIIPPNGFLTSGIRLREWLRDVTDTLILKRKVSEFMKKLVMTGIQQEYRDLGALYVLTALTMNSVDAAQAMPWLHDSVA